MVDGGAVGKYRAGTRATGLARLLVMKGKRKQKREIDRLILLQALPCPGGESKTGHR